LERLEYTSSRHFRSITPGLVGRELSREASAKRNPSRSRFVKAELHQQAMLKTLKECDELQQRPDQNSRDFSVQVGPDTPFSVEKAPMGLKDRVYPLPRLHKKMSIKSQISKQSQESRPRICCNYHINILSKEEHKIMHSLQQLEGLLEHKSQVLTAVHTTSSSPITSQLRLIAQARPKRRWG
jgi:hypothetical protein